MKGKGGPRIAGAVELAPMSSIAGDAIPVLFVVNGVADAMAITWPDRKGRLRIEAMLGEHHLAASDDALAVFLVEGEGAGAKLRPLTVATPEPRKAKRRAQ